MTLRKLAIRVSALVVTAVLVCNVSVVEAAGQWVNVYPYLNPGVWVVEGTTHVSDWQPSGVYRITKIRARAPLEITGLVVLSLSGYDDTSGTWTTIWSWRGSGYYTTIQPWTELTMPVGKAISKLRWTSYCEERGLTNKNGLPLCGVYWDSDSWPEDPDVYLESANPPGAATGFAATQTSVQVWWQPNGNPNGTQYYVEARTLNGAVIANSGWVTSTTASVSGLAPGTNYTFYAKAKNSDGVESSWTYLGDKRTVPPTPNSPTGSITPLSWSNTAGRDRVVLTWPAQTGATGYKVWVFDGNAYRAFDVGNVTTWDSSAARIYPPEGQLDSYGDNTQSGDLFYRNQGGLDLRDDPNKLYRKTVGSTYDGAHNYWFRVSAYNESGESPMSDAYMPTLPNRTDTQVPQITSVVINNGDAKTGALTAHITVKAKDPGVANYTPDPSDDASGVSQIRFSNDNTVWSPWQPFDTTPTAPNEERIRSFTWDLAAGGGTKTVYVQVMDQAGNISQTAADTILFVDDVTAPQAQLTINGGDASTSSRSVTLTITATDDLTATNGLQMRFSNDGITFSPYEPYAPTKTWDLAWPNSSTPDGEKVVYMQVRDGQGNTVTVTDKIGLNTQPPAGTATPQTGTAGTITAGGETVTTRFTNTPRVTISLTPQRGDRVQFSTDGVNWSPWEAIPASGVKRLVLPPGDGQKTVFIRWGNRYGGESEVQTVEFTVDTTPPDVSLRWENRATITSASSLTLLIQARDNVTATPDLKVRFNGGTWQAYSPFMNVPLSGTGFVTVMVDVMDQAGNITTSEIGIFRQ